MTPPIKELTQCWQAATNPPSTDRREMKRHETVQDKNSLNLLHKLLFDTEIAEKYDDWQTKFVNTLLQFEHTWDKHLGSISTVKQRIELLELTTRSVHSAPYFADQKDYELEKQGRYKMFKENIIIPNRWTGLQKSGLQQK